MSELCLSFHRIKDDIAFPEIRYEAGDMCESRRVFLGWSQLTHQV